MSLSFTAKVNVIQNPRGNLVAFANLIVNDVVSINGFRVLNGQHGLFVSPPQTKSNKANDDGTYTYYDDVRFLEDVEEGERRGPVASEALKTILDEYNAITSASGDDSRPTPTGDRPNSGKRKPRW